MTTRAAIPVDDRSLRDLPQPGRHLTAPGVEASPGSPGASKDFARHVLCLVPVRDPGTDVAPDGRQLGLINVDKIHAISHLLLRGAVSHVELRNSTSRSSGKGNGG